MAQPGGWMPPGGVPGMPPNGLPQRPGIGMPGAPLTGPPPMPGAAGMAPPYGSPPPGFPSPMPPIGAPTGPGQGPAFGSPIAPPAGGANAIPMGAAGQDGGWAGRQQMKNQKATTLFVGSIPDGVTDRWIKMLFETCGQIASYNRPNKAFCFVEFSHPDSVLRALTTLNELELPGLPVDAGLPSKKLKVKADAKTGKFLEEWKSQRDDADDAALDAQATASIEALTRNMRDPNFRLPNDPTEKKPAYETPAHLKDLTEEELPEEVRGSVLGEIAQFRVSASAREEDKRRQQAEMEKIKADRMRAARQQQDNRSFQPPTGPSGAGPSRGMAGPGDAAPSFVPSAGMNGVRLDDLDPEERDEVEEKMRKEKLAETRRMDAQIAENKHNARERVRLARWEKDIKRDKADAARRKDDADRFLRRCERWDPDNEPFYYERSRWRRQREAHLQREEAADAQDIEDEKISEEKAKVEAERFLQQQEEEMRKLAEQQRAAGVLLPGAVESGPLKLTIAPKAKETIEDESHSHLPQPAAAKTALLGSADDDDDAQLRRKKLAPINFNDTKTEEELRALRHAELKKIRERLPKDWEGISSMLPDWDYVGKTITENRQFIDEQVMESLGESAPELSDAVIEKLTAKASAADIVEEVEPVLDEEATPFVEKIWRRLIENSSLAAAGL